MKHILLYRSLIKSLAEEAAKIAKQKDPSVKIKEKPPYYEVWGVRERE